MSVRLTTTMYFLAFFCKASIQSMESVNREIRFVCEVAKFSFVMRCIVGKSQTNVDICRNKRKFIVKYLFILFKT